MYHTIITITIIAISERLLLVYTAKFMQSQFFSKHPVDVVFRCIYKCSAEEVLSLIHDKYL